MKTISSLPEIREFFLENKSPLTGNSFSKTHNGKQPTDISSTNFPRKEEKQKI